MGKMTLLVLTFGLACSICGAAPAQDSKLNAPVSRQPTVASEIERGNELGFACGLHAIPNASRLIDCVNDAIDDNRQKTTLSEPFEFGLYVAALQQAHSVFKIPLGGFVSLWRDRMAKIMKSRKLSLSDFCKATGAEKCDATVMAQETYGGSR